jgi:hypothetical protein
MQLLLRSLSDEERRQLTKKNFKGFIKKSLLLIDARINEKEVPKELEEDYKLILRKTPVIVKSSVNTACERSTEYARGQQFFIGKLCIESLILFQQHFIQGRSYELSDSYLQLDLSAEEIDKVAKKKKKGKITDLRTLMEKEEERDYFLGLLDSNRSTYIRECLEYFPRIELQCDFKVDGESTIAAGDFFQVIVTISSNRLSNFCSAVTYPFLKMEGWHLIISEAGTLPILLHEVFSFDELTKTFKVTFRQEKQGRYALTLKLMSDCYFGLDIERDFKYDVGPKSHHHEKEVEDEEVEEESYIRKIFNSLVPQEE